MRCPWHTSPAGCGGSPSGLLFPSPLWHVSLHWLGHQMAASGLIYFPSPIPCPVLILEPKGCRSNRSSLCFPYLYAVHLGLLAGSALSYAGSFLCPILPCLTVSPVLCICAPLLGTIGAGSRTGSEAAWPLASAPAPTPVPDSTPSRRSSLTSGRPARADDSEVDLTFLDLYSTRLLCPSAGVYLPVEGLPVSARPRQARRCLPR